MLLLRLRFRLKSRDWTQWTEWAPLFGLASNVCRLFFIFMCFFALLCCLRPLSPQLAASSQHKCCFTPVIPGQTALFSPRPH